MTVQVAGYPEYVAAVREHLPADLATHRGEMVQGRLMSVLRGINSARMPLKQRYAAAEEALLTAETIAALAWLNRGAPYPHAELRHAWRELLRNSPHNSISGCSVDESHLAMAGRFLTAELIADRVRRESMAAVAGKTADWSHGEPISDEYSVVNPLPWARREIVELPGLGAVAVELPAFGATTVTKRAAGPSSSAPVVTSAKAIDNGIVRVEIEPAGTVAVVDLASGHRWGGLHEFEDVADRGDEYNFCPVDGDRAIGAQPSPVRIRVIKAGPLVGEVELERVLRLPRAMTADRRRRARASVSTRVATLIRLTSGSPRRISDPADEPLARSQAARHLLGERRWHNGYRREPVRTVETIPRPASSGAGWREPPIPTQHTRGLVVAGSLGVAGRGLPEYEALAGANGRTNAIALTLLRCVGWLSRDDLTTRPGHAGPALPVADAQCLGEHHFEYALWVGERSAAEWLRESSNWRRPFAFGEAGAPSGSLLDVGGEGFGDGALKGAQDGDGVVLRVFAGPDGAAVTLPQDLHPDPCRSMSRRPAKSGRRCDHQRFEAGVFGVILRRRDGRRRTARLCRNPGLAAADLAGRQGFGPVGGGDAAVQPARVAPGRPRRPARAVLAVRPGRRDPADRAGPLLPLRTDRYGGGACEGPGNRDVVAGLLVGRAPDHSVGRSRAVTDLRRGAVVAQLYRPVPGVEPDVRPDDPAAGPVRDRPYL